MQVNPRFYFRLRGAFLAAGMPSFELNKAVNERVYQRAYAALGAHVLIERCNMKRRNGYIYTNKEHTKFGIMSTVLGVLANVTLLTSIYLSYTNKGVVPDRYGSAAFLAVVFMIVGIGLGLWSTIERDKFRFFSVVGIVVNILAFGVLSIILYAGAYVN